MRHNKEENHSLFNEGVTKIVFKYQKKAQFCSIQDIYFYVRLWTKKSPQKLHIIEIQTMFTVVIWVWFSLKTSQLFLFSAIIRPNRQTYMRRWKEHTKKNCRKSSWNDADVSTKKTIEKNFLFIGNFLCVHIPITPFINWMWQWWQQTCSG